jgi:hypothetical protein
MDNYSTQSSVTPLRQYLASIRSSSSATNKDRDELENMFENAFSQHGKKPSNFSLAMFKQSQQNKAQIVDDPLRINP